MTSIAAVVIGRNEGERLITCFKALKGQVESVIYVDSGSTDGSVAVAKEVGALVVELDMNRPFTAARARNAGLAEVAEGMEFVQFLDGDCEIRDGWLERAGQFLHKNPQVAVVCGRRRERFPKASVYNQLIDDEWDTPIGQTKACGGDAMMRVSAIRAVGGYTDTLIAGEEPELCVRLRGAGWQIWRLDAEMTWHDADLRRFGQWWRRSQRAGFAFAEGAFLHGAPPERHWVAETRRAAFWGGLLPTGILLGAVVFSPWFILLFLIYPAQVIRLSRRKGFVWSLFNTLSKFPEAQGAGKFMVGRMVGRRSGIIEYK